MPIEAEAGVGTVPDADMIAAYDEATEAAEALEDELTVDDAEPTAPLAPPVVSTDEEPE